MIPPVRMEPSVPSAVPSREALALLRILVVAGEGGSAGGLLQNLRQWADDGRLEIDTAPDLPRAVRQLSGQRWDVVLAVLGEHPDDDLSWWVDTLRGATGSPRFIAVAQAPSMGLVLRAEKSGVLGVLALPLRREELMRALERVRSVVSETAVPLPLVEPHAVGPYALVGQSPAMLDVYKLLARVAGSAATVLVQGESGTGKEVAARAIHMNGPHASGAFVAVNCAAIPENLLESELFGHEKGAFTGAVTRKIGRFEQAGSGTLFLDEIADMSLALQAKILRAVQEREIERVGGSETIPVDVRLIAATNRDLKEAIKQGRFREDLYYRLAVVTIRLPTLVERGDDLVLLTAYYVRLFAERYGKTIHAISDRVLELLRAHAWVGNVRELRNVIERAVIVATDETLRAEHLPDELRGEETTLADRPQGGLLTLAEAEARHIARVLAHTSPWGNVASTRTSCDAGCRRRFTASWSTCRCSSRGTWRRSNASSAATRPAWSRRCCAPAGSRRRWAGTPRRGPGTRWRSASRKRSRIAARRWRRCVRWATCVSRWASMPRARVISSARSRSPSRSSIRRGPPRRPRGWETWRSRRDNGAVRRRGIAGDSDSPRLRATRPAPAGWSDSLVCWHGSNATLPPRASSCGGHESASKSPASRTRWRPC